MNAHFNLPVEIFQVRNDEYYTYVYILISTTQNNAKQRNINNVYTLLLSLLSLQSITWGANV